MIELERKKLFCWIRETLPNLKAKNIFHNSIVSFNTFYSFFFIITCFSVKAAFGETQKSFPKNEVCLGSWKKNEKCNTKYPCKTHFMNSFESILVGYTSKHV